jgi:hypothetical protein
MVCFFQAQLIQCMMWHVTYLIANRVHRPKERLGQMLRHDLRQKMDAKSHLVRRCFAVTVTHAIRISI